MNKLNQVKGLLDRLTIDEKRIFQRVFLNDNIGTSKSKKLFDILISKDDYSSIDVQKYLYSNQNYTAFNKLINRFEEKILDSILLDQNLSNQENYTKRNQINFVCRKQLIQADVLQLRGERVVSEKIYKKVISESALYEFYDILVQALSSYQRLNNAYVKKSKKIQQQIEVAEQCWTLLNKSRNEYNYITNKISVSKSYLSYNDELSVAVSHLQEFYNATKSALIGYYYYTLKVELLQINNDYKSASSDLDSLYELVIKNPSVYTSNRLGTILINKANNELQLRNFDLAIDYTLEAKKHFIGLPYNILVSNEILFLCFYFLGNDSEAAVLIEEMLSSSYSLNKLLYNKYLYFKACLLIKMEEFGKAVDVLSETNKYEFDKGDLFILSKIAVFIVNVELNSTEGLDSLVQSLDKYVIRASNDRKLPLHIKKIIRVMIFILNSGFDFAEIAKNSRVRKYINEITSSKAKGLSSLTSELVSFDQWVISKLPK